MGRRVLAACTIVCLAVVSAALALQDGTRTVLQTVPSADTDHPSGLILGDAWSFVGRAGDVISIEVDTRDDKYEGTALLDPTLVLRRPDGSDAVSGDDEAECSRPPVCGYDCPRVRNFSLDQTGRWTIVVRDFGGATETGTFCTGGAYNLSVTGTVHALETLKLRTDDGTVQQLPTALRGIAPTKGAQR
jgi:hypothetical protein